MRRLASLFSAFVWLALFALAQHALAQSTADRRAISPDWRALQSEAVQKLSAYVAVNTTNPPGNEIRAAQWYAKIFRAEGIPFEIAESAPGRASIVARLKGTGSEPGVILLNHMDVVPVSRAYWTVDPFAGIVHDGYLWGRGSIDMKSLGILQLLTFLELHRLRVPLRRDVIFLGTADEEAGGNFGAGWVVTNRPQWIAGVGFMLTEGAGSLADASGKPIYFGVGPTEKTPAWLRLVATGRAGHASVPIPDSAPNRLVAALDRLRQYRPPLELTPPVEAMLGTHAPYEPEPWRSRFLNLKAFLAQPDAYDLLEKRPDILARLTNTISITSLQGSNKTNIIPPEASAEIDCRLLPSWTIDRWVAQIGSIINDPSIRVEVILNFPPAVSSTDTPLFAAIQNAVHELDPSAGVVQTVDAGFTDSHFFRGKGIVSYGFAPFAITREDDERVHGDNERIPVKNYTDGAHLLWNVVYDFAGAK
ncbi:MAG: M20/M25/M40 family metallo-hydrolase [Candidatus Acidiferrales bacterium]